MTLPDCEVRALRHEERDVAVYEGWQRRLDRRVLVRVLGPVPGIPAEEQLRQEVGALTSRGVPIYEAGVLPEGLVFVLTAWTQPSRPAWIRGLFMAAVVLLIAGAGWVVWREKPVAPAGAASAPRYPFPMRLKLTGVSLSPEMQAAKARGGRLRCWGTFRGRYTLEDRPKATAKWDDYVRVQGEAVQFVAQRKNGELFGWHAGRSGERHFWKPEVTAISRGWRTYFQAGGKVFTYQASVPHATLARAGAVMAVEQYGYLFSLSADGVAEWTDMSPEKISRSPAPPELWARVSQVVGSGNEIDFLDDTGTLRAWQSGEGLLSNRTQSMTDIVEMDTGSYELITLSADGTVRVNGNLPALQPPADLGKCVAVRAGVQCCAAQRPDGTWRAWGVDPEMAVQVAKIGKAIDLDLEVSGPPWDVNVNTPRRFVIWIEPVVDAPPRQPTGPQSWGGSRYEFIPGQCTWAEARAKAEALGGHLATMDSTEEAAWLMKTFGDAELSDGRAFWIGGQAKDAASGWQWVTGKKAEALTWLPGRPAVGVNEDAGVFPAWLAVLQLGDQVGIEDCSDHAASIRHWANHIVGFLVEWER